MSCLRSTRSCLLGLVFLAAILVPSVIAAGPPAPKPNRPPTVSLMNPDAGDTFVAPAKIVLRAKAQDKDGHVTSVKFYSGTTLLFTCEHEPPYVNDWLNVPPGTYVLTAVATDDTGASATSSPVTITVKANQAPTVQITSPADGDRFDFGKPIMISADAHDADGRIRRVNFYADGQKIGHTDTHAPYMIMWRHPRRGAHVLTAVAVDDKHAETTSAEVQIVVDKAEPPPAPVVEITSPAAGQVFQAGAAVPLAANASVAGGATLEVQFLVDGNPVGAPDTSAPYEATFDATPAGNHTVQAKATSSAGPSTTSAGVTVIVNAPPTVTLAGTGDTTAPADLTLTADASDTDGTVDKVDLYVDNGLTPITDTTAPFEFNVTGVAAGDHTFRAVATDNHGGIGESNVVNITVDDNESGGQTPVGSNVTVEIADVTVTFSEVTVAGTTTVVPLVVDPSQIPAGVSLAGTLGFDVQTTASYTGDIVACFNVSSIAPDEATFKKLRILHGEGGGTFSYRTVLQPLTPAPSFADHKICAGVSSLSPFVIVASADVLGPYQVGGNLDEPGFAGFIDGYFGLVPPAWQTALGGPVLNGNCCLGVISRTSFGPALFTIDPSQLGVTNPLPVTPLVYYPTDHPLAPHDGTNAYFNGTTEVRGVVFPTGRQSVLFFGRHGGFGGAAGVPGNGDYCYGPGTGDPALVGTTPEGELDAYCYDPEDSNKGVHGYPYRYQVWAYDANDLAEVASGAMQSWDVTPYAVWQVNLPFAADNTHVGGATYDPATGSIYISQAQGDGELPLIHRFMVQGADPLIQAGDLIYEGAFRVPEGQFPSFGLTTDWQLPKAKFNFAGVFGGAMAFNPTNGSLFMVGDDQGQLVAEVSIPAVLSSPDVNSLNTATVLQPFSDVSDGLMDSVNPTSPNAKKIGGLLPYQDQLYVTVYDYYDGNGSQIRSHFVSGLDIDTSGAP